MVARLQRPHFVCDAEQVSDEILEMGCRIDQKVRLAPVLDRAWLMPRCRQPAMQRDISLGEMGDKSPVEAHEAVAIVRPANESPWWRRSVIRVEA